MTEPRVFPKIRYDIEVIEEALKIIKEFNSFSIEYLQLYKRGKPIKMRNLEEFKRMGLSNKDYVKYQMNKVGSNKI